MPGMAPRTRSAIDSQRFFEYINSADELTLVVRGHLSLEAALNLIIETALPRPLDLEGLRFSQKVDLAIALGRIDPGSRAAWAKVNAIRNRFAHDLDAAVTKREAREALELLPKIMDPPPLESLDHPRGPAAMVGWCMAALWARAINTGLFGSAPTLPAAPISVSTTKSR
jgi:hypothetical protein